MIIRKIKCLMPLLLGVLLTVLCFQISVLASNEISVSTLEELKSAITNAPTDGTEMVITVTGEITCETANYVVLSAGKNITIIGGEGSSLEFKKARAILLQGGTLTFKDINITTTANAAMFCSYGTLILDDVSLKMTYANGIVLGTAGNGTGSNFYVKGNTTINCTAQPNGSTPIFFANGSSTVGTVNVYIEGGSISQIADTTNTPFIKFAASAANAEYNHLYVTPKADISINARIISGAESDSTPLALVITPVDGYNISSVSLDGSALSADSNGSYSVTAVNSCLEVKVAGSSSTTPAEIPAEAITNNAGATVSSSIEGNTATLNVACDQACVVAYTTDGGATYTRLTATANGDAYDFSVAYTEGMQFIVAVKGDADGNGSINANDLSLFVDASNGSFSSSTYSAGLMLLIGDTDNNGTVNANDLSSLVDASNGNELDW